MELVADPYEQETESEDEPEIEVSKWTCPEDGKEYLLDKSTMTIYDIETQEEVGTWHEDEQEIVASA